MEFSLELAEERLSLLKEKFDYVVSEKINDSNLYEQIMANTKNMILQMYRANRNENITEPEMLQEHQ